MNPEASIEQQKVKNKKQIEKEAYDKKVLETQKREQAKLQLEASAGAQINQLTGALAGARERKASLESALTQMPEGHPQRKKVQEDLKATKSQIVVYEQRLQKLTYDLKSQEKVINFRFSTHNQFIEQNKTERLKHEDIASQERRKIYTKMAGQSLARGGMPGGGSKANPSGGRPGGNMNEASLMNRMKESKQGAG